MTGPAAPPGGAMPGDGAGAARSASLAFEDVSFTHGALLVLTGIPLGLIGFLTVVVLLSMSVALVPTVLFSMVCATVLVLVARALAAVHRSRLRSLLRWHIAAPAAPRADGYLRWLRANLTSGVVWRQIAYAGPVGFVLFVAGSALAGGFAWSVVLVTSPLHSRDLLQFLPTGITLAGDGVATALGGAGLVLVHVLTRTLAWADARVAAVLLGHPASEALHRRVEQLAESRSGAVDAADAERRRIERDLHDGAQQRLTSLAMNLGVARATLPDLPEQARQVLDDAHTEAKAALTELRGIVRGLHPAVLDDRGLDAALSGLAARSPIPVALDVDLPIRPPRNVETVAYFVVSEALTNVVKHAGASRVQVSARLDGPRLRLRVVDDGVGGADPTRGTGLTGLRQRVASVDGRLTLESPPGGPTVLEADLPCA